MIDQKAEVVAEVRNRSVIARSDVADGEGGGLRGSIPTS